MRARSRVAWLLLLLACHSGRGNGAHVLDLGGQGWSLANANASVRLNTRVPGYALEALRGQGKIPDPLYRYNELTTRWVAYDTWTWSTTVNAPAALVNASSTFLQLGGVDTFAKVVLNGRVIVQTDNFHRKWLVPLKSSLRAGKNELSISIAPAALVAKWKKLHHPYSISTIATMGAMDVYNFARKPASDFGWDWGPAFAAAGIHGGVKVVGLEEAELTGAHVQQRQNSTHWLLTVEVEWMVPADGDAATLSVQLPLGSGQPALTKAVPFKLTKERPGLQHATFELAVPVKSVKLWWPVGYGSQPLYYLKLQWRSSSFTKQIGFRTVQIVRRPLKAAAKLLLGSKGGWTTPQAQPSYTKKDWEGVWGLYDNGSQWKFVAHAASPNVPKPGSIDYPWDAPIGGGDPWWYGQPQDYTAFDDPRLAAQLEGESFYFSVNGVPVFAKGANLVPISILPTNATRSTLLRLLTAAKESNMNMIRIWGGGVYQDDLLYDWADKNGMMVWVESMFACSAYPRDDSFMATVKAETEQQVRRLGSHPSLVVWGGNNEVELALGWYKNTRSYPNAGLAATDYQALFGELIPSVVTAQLPHVPYLDSSPSNGMISGKPFIKRWGFASDDKFGDQHYYNYKADCLQWGSFPQTKFASEFGWQSYPSWHTYKAATAPKDWSVTGLMSNFRMRHPGGVQEISNLMAYHFRQPPNGNWNHSKPEVQAKRLQKWLLLGQLEQALCDASITNYWRRLKSNPQALSMGALYWQMNDVWAGASWSGIDIAGRWKPMQYAIKSAFATLQIQLVQDGAAIQAFLVSDLPEAVSTKLTIILRSTQDTSSACAAKPRVLVSTTVTALALHSRVVWWKPDLAAVLAAAPGCDKFRCYLEATISGAPARGIPGSEAVHWPVYYKDLALRPATLKLSQFTQASDTTVRFTVSSSAVAPLTWLDTELLGHFDDNMLTVHPCHPRRITFISDNGPVKAARLQQLLSAASVQSHQYFAA